MAQSPINRITRDQLAAFLKDFRTIRQFEELFATQQQDLPAALILAEEAVLAAGTADATAQQAVDTIASLRDALDFVTLAPPLEPRPTPRLGAFADTTTQTAAVANTAYALTFNTTNASRGVVLSSPASRVRVDASGVYVFAASVQLDKTGAGAGSVWLWLRLNGSADVANSARQFRVSGTDAETAAALVQAVPMASGDYVELMWGVDATDIQVQASASAAFRPAVPSVLLTVTMQP